MSCYLSNSLSYQRCRFKGTLNSYPDLTLFYTEKFPLAVGDLGTRLTAPLIYRKKRIYILVVFNNFIFFLSILIFSLSIKSTFKQALLIARWFWEILFLMKHDVWIILLRTFIILLSFNVICVCLKLTALPTTLPATRIPATKPSGKGYFNSEVLYLITCTSSLIKLITGYQCQLTVILDHWLRQFVSFDWLSHHRISVTMPCSTDMVNKRLSSKPKAIETKPAEHIFPNRTENRDDSEFWQAPCSREALSVLRS